jgi:hypothetical protein
MHSARVSLCTILGLVTVLPATLLASTPSFTKHFSPGQATTLHADLNNDGCEDMVYNNGNGGFDVQFSHCDGTYGAPVAYTIPGGADAGPIAIADLNRDGRADLAVFGSDNAVHVFLNYGGGLFAQGAVYSGAGIADAYTVAVGDFNHDGKMDVAYQSGLNVNVLFGNGTGSFVAGPSRSVEVGGYLMMGDFDGDGHADLAIGDLTNYNLVQVIYGDGTGHFPAEALIDTVGGHSMFTAADVNGDGVTDIIGSQFYPSTHDLALFYGNHSRTWTTGSTVVLSHCAAFSATAADMNGDGIKDLVVNEADCNNNSQQGNAYVALLTRNPNGSYNPDQILQTSPSYIDAVSAIRANRDNRPDISFLSCKISPCSIPQDLEIGTLLNTTTGNFPLCGAPVGVSGINVCMPYPGSTVGSPVSFQVAAAGQVAMRKVEVWVDGRKLAEQLDGFSHYTYMNRYVSISAGYHQVVIYAAGWDNSLQRRAFTLNVR